MVFFQWFLIKREVSASILQSFRSQLLCWSCRGKWQYRCVSVHWQASWWTSVCISPLTSLMKDQCVYQSTDKPHDGPVCVSVHWQASWRTSVCISPLTSLMMDQCVYQSTDKPRDGPVCVSVHWQASWWTSVCISPLTSLMMDQCVYQSTDKPHDGQVCQFHREGYMCWFYWRSTNQQGCHQTYIKWACPTSICDTWKPCGKRTIP